jgi:hypothetical protein
MSNAYLSKHPRAKNEPNIIALGHPRAKSGTGAANTSPCRTKRWPYSQPREPLLDHADSVSTLGNRAGRCPGSRSRLCHRGPGAWYLRPSMAEAGGSSRPGTTSARICWPRVWACASASGNGVSSRGSTVRRWGTRGSPKRPRKLTSLVNRVHHS